MCFTGIFYHDNEHNDIKEFIVFNTFREMNTNSDGFAIRVPSGFIRTLEIEEARQFLLDYATERIVHLHYRIASAGGVNISNVHGFFSPKQPFFLTHNGHLQAYDKYLLGRQRSDTYCFVDNEEGKILKMLDGDLSIVDKLSLYWSNIIMISSLDFARTVLISYGKPIQVLLWRRKKDKQWNVAYTSAQLVLSDFAHQEKVTRNILGWVITETKTKSIIKAADILKQIEIVRFIIVDQAILLNDMGAVLSTHKIAKRLEPVNSIYRPHTQWNQPSLHNYYYEED